MNASQEPRIHAAGAVLWDRDAAGNPVVALVHRPHHNDWSLPKGKVDPGESSPVTAVREIQEETGFRAHLGPFLTRVRYDVPDNTTASESATVPKAVDYFGARVDSGAFAVNSEVDALRWLPVRDAESLTSYGDDVSVLEQFLALPLETTTVLLLRHAKAGKRAEFAGDDDLRPLSPAGARQAEQLRDMLAAFAPARVIAAPRLRCVQTVQGCARELRTEVDHEPLFSEEEYADSPDRALRRFDEIVAASGTAVVCSQGKVIPHLVETLAARDHVTLPVTKAHPEPGGSAVAAKKASTWLLSFTDDGPRGRHRLVAASYFRARTPVPIPR